ncbi:MAG: FAD-binding domain-containing protein [Actinomycetota bacterium]
MPTSQLPVPPPGRAAAEAFVAEHLRGLFDDEVAASAAFRGGQSAADLALSALDVGGYASRRNEVEPPGRRGASRLSPYIRHGLLDLPRVWRAVEGGPGRDVAKFRDELLWQEYARHWYARLGDRTGRGIRRELEASAAPGWGRLPCVTKVVEELERDGWLVNQTRMWLASHWAIRRGADWREGEDEFFRHLLDGSRAANRLGWQWTTGVGSSKPYGFSRWQVEKRGSRWCRSCELRDRCPIQDWPDDPSYVDVEPPTPTGLEGSLAVEVSGVADAVWITAESLGDDDPALAANPALPVIFVFDEPLLRRLRLSSKRLVFLTETLADLAMRRDVRLHLGDPVAVLAKTPVAVTHAPVPGFARRARALQPAEVHPWPWLAPPHGRSVSSFSAWRKHARPGTAYAAS